MREAREVTKVKEGAEDLKVIKDAQEKLVQKDAEEREDLLVLKGVKVQEDYLGQDGNSSKRSTKELTCLKNT